MKLPRVNEIVYLNGDAEWVISENDGGISHNSFVFKEGTPCVVKEVFKEIRGEGRDEGYVTTPACLSVQIEITPTVSVVVNLQLDYFRMYQI